MSLRKKLLLSLIAIAVLPVLVLGAVCYSYFNKVLLSNVQQRELQNNNQIIYVMDDFFQSLTKISDSLLMSEALIDILQKTYQGPDARLTNYRDRRDAEELLYRNGYYLDRRIEAIAIFPENSALFYHCSINTVNPVYDVKQEGWYRQILAREGAQVLVGVHKNTMTKALAGEDPHCITIGRSIYSAYEARLLGTILINVNVEDLGELCLGGAAKESERFYLTDAEGRVVYSDRAGEIGGELELSAGLAEGVSSLRVDGVLYDVLVSSSREHGWKSVKMIARSELNREIAFVPRVTLMLAAALIVPAALVALFISSNITRPLQELYVKMCRFEATIGGEQPPVDPVVVGNLSTSYNRVIDQINALTVKNYETEVQLRRAELMALQSQIHPHFVYNTLNSIKWMADMQGSRRMVAALDSLIKLLQFSSKNSGEFIYIRDEVNLVRDYVNLINLKFFDRLSVAFHLEEGVETYMTLRFLLQPIVENAIYHGFDGLQQPCEIRINITRVGECILYEVIDNGKGMPPEKVRQALEEEGSKNSHSFNKIGLYNVNKRIQYIFGGEYGLQIDSVLGEYTRVLVEIPARRFEEGE